MKLSVLVSIQNDADTTTVVREVFTLERGSLAPGTLGLQIDEAKDMLSAIQDKMVSEQVKAAITEQVACPACGLPRRHKDARDMVVHSLFGTLRLSSPRWWHYPCVTHETGAGKSVGGR